MAMKLVKKTDNYSIYLRGDDRYAVKDAARKPVNGEEKVAILVAEELVKVSVPAEPVAEEVADEEVAEEAAEASAEESAAEEPAAEEAPAEDGAADEDDK